MSTSESEAGRHARSGGGARPGAVPGSDLTDLVVAARGGDRRAEEALIAAHLPLLYRVVGRALDGHADVDDVVQETVLRAHRDLPSLRTPGSFRSWLVAIATHQVSTRLRGWQQDRDRSAPLDEAARTVDPEADFGDVTLLRLGLSAQRRQVAEAAGWLDPGDRRLVAIWWREVAGEISRADLVAALGVSSAHARVRIQRMRQQLELSRYLVAALEARPRCPGLAAVAGHWDGTPGPRWRKRFARHLRDCDVCGAVRAGLFPLERLLVGAAAVHLPVTAGMAGALAGATAAGTAATVTTAGTGLGSGIAGWFAQLAGAKVVAATLVGAAVSGGVYLALPQEPPPTATSTPPGAAPAPAARGAGAPTRTPGGRPASSRPAPASAPAGLVPLGRVTLRPAGQPGAVVALDGDFLVTATGVPATVLTALPGITDQQCVSLRADDGRWFRHASFNLMLSTEEDRQLFRMDATFCPEPGPEAGTVRLTSFNYPDRYVRIVDGRLRLDTGQGDAAYLRASTFVIGRPR